MRRLMCDWNTETTVKSQKWEAFTLIGQMWPGCNVYITNVLEVGSEGIVCVIFTSTVECNEFE